MISVISLKNFQSHPDSRLELSPGVNVIVGPSDSGKTAIIRALRWLATNRPTGDAFIRAGKGGCEVGVALDNGVEVHRLRAGSKNFYEVVPEDKDEQVTLGAVGTDLPKPVTDALRISDLSWQSQMDAPFLLSASPGEVARALNEVADLDKIDEALANVNRMARDNKRDLLTAGQEAQGYRVDLAKYRHVDRWAAKAAELVRAAAEADDLEAQSEHIEAVAGGIDEAGRTLAAVKDPSRAYEVLDMVSDFVGQLREVGIQRESLSKHVNMMLVTQQALAEADRVAQKTEETWTKAIAGKCPLCGRG